MLSNVQLSCFLLSYLAASCGEVYQLLRGRSAASRWWLIGFSVAGLVAHTAYLVTRSSDSGLPPLVGSSHDWLLVLAWLVAAIYLLVVVMSGSVAVSLFVVPPLIALVVLATQVEDSAGVADRVTATHRWGMLHASTLVLGIAGMVAATLCAAMYLVQYQKLRGGKSWIHRLQLPSLERLTSLNRSLVVATVAMLTIGLVSGLILISSDNTGGIRWSDPIVAGTSAVWLILVAYLCWLILQKGQIGRQVAQLTLLNGVFLMVTVFGLMLVSGGVHGTSSSDKAQAANKAAGIVEEAQR